VTNFRLDVSRETGEATLWMFAEETSCGYQPVLGWPNIEGIREFAQMLLDIYCQREEKRSERRVWKAS